jgi:hypothetical protein
VVGTLNDIPVSFPFNSGKTKPTALAAPVDEGIMLVEAALPALQSFPPEVAESTTFLRDTFLFKKKKIVNY